MEQEWSVFDLKRYWKVRALPDSVLKLVMGDKTPRAGLGKAETRIHDAGELMYVWAAGGRLTKSEMTISLTRRLDIV